MKNASHRFWPWLAAAVAVTMFAVPTASAGVVKYDTHLTITTDGSSWYHGGVKSKVKKCEDGRRVIVFKQRPGADRRIGADRSKFIRRYHQGDWFLRPGQGPPRNSGPIYAKVRRKVLKDGDVCFAARSATI